MFDFLKWINFKKDVPPGTLVYAGKGKDFTPSITTVTYNRDSLTTSHLETAEEIKIVDGAMNFIHVIGIHEPEIIKALGTKLNLPVLALEDVMNTGQRSKLTWIDDETGFFVLKNLEVKDQKVSAEQISMFWRPGCVLVFSENESNLLDGVMSRLNKSRAKIRGNGSDYLATAILDAIVDRQLYALGQIGGMAETLETELLEKLTDERLGQLYEIKRETILLRNSLMPVQDIFKELLRDDAGVSEGALPYLRDVAGHNAQSLEATVALHDILKSMIDYQISLIGIRTNNVMQFLTAIATIFIPLTFIAGVYGMNFQYMPELQWRYGYFIIWGVMGITAVTLILYFIKRKLL